MACILIEHIGTVFPVMRDDIMLSKAVLLLFIAYIINDSVCIRFMCSAILVKHINNVHG